MAEVVEVKEENINRLAYCKIVMHAVKYPSKPVMGVLVGKTTDGKPSAVDAIPLVHSYSLAPMMELAMLQVCLAC
jgi:hypothetical protein